MISRSFTIIGALTLLSAVAYAGPAPKELYGKSITVAWSESRDQRVETEKEVRNFGQAVKMNLYISRLDVRFCGRSSASWAVMIFAVIPALVRLRKLDQVQPQKNASISREGRSSCIANSQVARAALPSS
jgi:hypothetical protein